jgi:Lon protease-like protein
MPSLGVMMLRAHGGQRFRIHETRVLPDQRLEGRIELLSPDAGIPLNDEHLSCALTLKIVMDDIQAKGEAAQGENFEAPFEATPRLDDAAWVANRWCEILPIPLRARQALLEVDNAATRLAIVHSYLRQHQIIPA